jgi:cbb3-type cytochrome oxidase cytochrome c subunit
MADRGDTHYHVTKLNRWFAVSSIALLVSSVWMVLFDFQRPWKEYQRDFRAIEIERGQAALSTPEAQAAIEEEARIASEIEAVREELAARGGALEKARGELALLDDTRAKADAAARVAKQEAAWDRFLAEEHRLHHGADEAYESKLAVLKELEDEMAARAKDLKTAQAAVEDKELEIKAIQARVTELESAMKDSTRSIELVRKKMAAIAPEDMPTKLANLVRDDIPGLDFVGPTLKVNKVMPPNLTFELNFTKKPRIDMCQTCHVPIDREGYEEEEQPFKTHPRLDLFLTAKSPHPMSEFGCTICHRGAGEALTFQRVDHRANDEEQGEEWADEYHWHKQHYWDYPMLSSDYVEAGCVQCHKDSMEVIAPEAPQVAEGYELFERYGCYACHKVDWFPTKRRPGPTLAQIKQKTNEDFVHAWITDPRSFRPTTWMPQVFHLENYAADVKISDSNYGQGRPIMGDEWSETAVAAVASFVLSRSAEGQLPPVPVEGDALRGGEVFRLSGCLACHNVAGFTDPGPDEFVDLAAKPNDTNVHGPNLRGIATKTTPEWLFAWIKDPKAYWSETRMPDLRLPDQDIADIVAYVFEDPDGVFGDVPEGWEAGQSPYKRDVLEEQARWFFNRTHPDTLTENFETEWADDETLLEVVGERWVLNQGCHSCHEIPGLEDAQPVGTELTTWASKTVDKLDFGFIPEILAEAKGFEPGSNEFHHSVYEYKQYRENFLEQKLHAPRSFDRRKIKNPSERLRMPWFRFTDDEVEAITTFVAGLVEDEVPQARMIPTPDKLAMDTGLRVIRQKNCDACHVIDPGKVQFEDEDGHTRTVAARLAIFDDELFPPPMDDFQGYLSEYTQFMREDYDEEFEVEEVYAQLLETDVEIGDVGTTFAIENVESIQSTPPWGGAFVDIVTDHYLNGSYYDENDELVSLTGDPDGEGRVQDVDGEWRDFTAEPYDKVRWTYAPPVLIDEGSKLQNDWFFRFLVDPIALRPQIRVKMPSFDYAEGEAAAVADYFAHRARLEWPKEYAKQLQRGLGVTPEEIARGIADMRLSGSSANQVAGIAEGLPVETKAGLPNLLAYGDASGFEMYGPVDPAYESIPQRTPRGRDPFLAERPSFYQDVHALALGPDGPSCNQCHPVGGTDPTNAAPIGWAPDLDITRERLRPDWVRKWLTDPQKVYPGTTMPGNFDLASTQWQELYAAPSAQQIEAVLTWLFNLETALLRN